MNVPTQASLKSTLGSQPTSFCQRAESPKTSPTAARAAVSYGPTDEELIATDVAPMEVKPPKNVSRGRVSCALIGPSKSVSEFLYSSCVSTLNFGPPESTDIALL